MFCSDRCYSFKRIEPEANLSVRPSGVIGLLGQKVEILMHEQYAG